MPTQEEIQKTQEEIQTTAAITSATSEASTEAIENVNARAEEIKQLQKEAKEKLEKSRLAVKNLTVDKEKMQKKLKSTAKGFGKVILGMVKKTLTSSAKSKETIYLIKKKFDVGCPSKSQLKKIIKDVNRLSNVIEQIQQTINTIQTTTQTIGTLITALTAIIFLIKTLMITVGIIPPPATAPSGPLITAGKVADKQDEKIKRNQKIIKEGIQAILVISYEMTAVKTLLQEISALLSLCLIQSYETGEITDDEMEAFMDELNSSAINSSNEEVDKEIGGELLASLQPGANSPLGYRGYRLELQQNSKETTSLTSRRVVGYEIETNILTIATEYSFTTNTETLVQECKNLIDEYLIKIIPQPDPVQEEIIEEPELQIEYYGYLSEETPKRWFLIFEGVEIEFGSENEYFLDRLERGFPADYSEFDDRGKDPNYTAPKIPYYWGWLDGSGAIFWHSGDIDYGLAGSNDYMFNNGEEYLAHRAAHGFPMDFTDILNRGAEPDYESGEEEKSKENDAYIDSTFAYITDLKIRINQAILATKWFKGTTNPAVTPVQYAINEAIRNRDRKIYINFLNSAPPSWWQNQLKTNKNVQKIGENWSSWVVDIPGVFNGGTIANFEKALNVWWWAEKKIKESTPNSKGIDNTYNFNR